uniref:Uncharacterized protein n=1 Tax=Timema genevievae TaxID=629358 RepID=A0A7R9K3Z6_TIMGE|nr:unnamed protein product [Timema genevievae]
MLLQRLITRPGYRINANRVWMKKCTRIPRDLQNETDASVHLCPEVVYPSVAWSAKGAVNETLYWSLKDLGEERVWQSDKSVPGPRIEPRTPNTEA